MTITIDRTKCNGCGACVDVCPVNAIKIEQKKAVVSEECVGCGACVNECPNEAIAFQK
ncbi:MAG: 4Fe-4S binding protein [Candidatus Omnitrophota bacterium]|nr:4Fe-4S binding protein [Candidatus Omnitrophota bacterium]MBU1894463.1 4Fe-4S binding protein [Candidatus Omnitrophota bacterium]